MAGSNISDIKFSYFCKVCEKVKAQKLKQEAGVILQKFIDYVMKEDPITFFPVLRLLLPQLDRERGPFGVKEKNLARTYKRILGLPPNSREAKVLTNFTSPSNIAYGAMGDFAEIVSCILKNRCGLGNEMTVGDVNKCLDNIALKHSQNDPRGVDDVYTEMINNMSHDEQKWLVRIIVKSMNLGIGEKKILNLFHPDAHKMYVLTNDIKKVCEKLRDRSIRYFEFGIELFQAFRPMLCERGDIHNLSINIPHYVETKMDGERFQLHYKERTFKYYSRNGNDYSTIYGDAPENGHYTSLIMKQFSPELSSCILDGEMMGWQRDKNTFVQKAVNLDVKKLKIGSTIQPCFVVFDILLYNDVLLTNRPLTERIEFLQKIFSPLEGVIMHVSRFTVNKEKDAFDSLNNAIDNNEEGIIIKRPDSLYIPNSRKGGWMKIKPDYSEGTDDLDLLIIGGYFGTGRKAGKICYFLLGVAEESSGEPDKFLSVARVCSGISDSELEELSGKLTPHWVKFKGHAPPFLLLKREKPDVYINPAKSVVLQVKSPEIIRSELYYTEYTLRFARVERIRYDKLWSDCLKVNEFHDLRTRAAGKLTYGHIMPGTSTGGRKRKHFTNQNPPIKILNIEKTSDILIGKEICVVNSAKDLSKEEIEKIIRQNGGSVVQYPKSSTFCVLYGNENIRVRNIIKAKKHNVAQYSWLLDCIKSNELVPWSRQNLVSSDMKTDAMLSEQLKPPGYDCFETLSIGTLKDLFSKIDPVPACSIEEMKLVNETIFNGLSPYSLFSNYHVFFDGIKINDDDNTIRPSLKNAEMIFRFQAGVVHSNINDDVSHIILHDNHLDNLLILQQLCEEKDVFCKFISYRWIIDSFNCRNIAKQDDYMINKTAS